MLSNSHCLGVFGDERLEKRGLNFLVRWCLVRASVAAAWPVADVARLSVSTDFLRIVV